MPARTILILDAAPEASTAAAVRATLEGAFDAVRIVNPGTVRRPIGAALWPVVTRAAADLIVVVLAAADGVAEMVAALARRPGPILAVPLVAVIENPDTEAVSALLAAGFSDYVGLPVTASQLVPRVRRLLPRGETAPAPKNTPDAPPLPHRLVGRSAPFQAELDKLPLIARCETGVLIEGETGTGKELFARAVHEMSARAGRPFVAVNCGAIPVELAESELFGHERGAFTGAVAAHKGVIAQADGGTLFLDEVASLPLLTQVKLLRFLQEREYRPLGATAPSRADVRVIAAANIRLASAVQTGRFRQDLFYRLNIIRVALPALRQRRDDIPELAAYFLSRHARRLGSAVSDLSTAACEKLMLHDWPGNIRELEHTLERAVVFATGPVLQAPDIVLGAAEDEATAADSFKKAKAKSVALFERSYIEGLLAANRGNISRAAKSAGKNRRAFWELIRKHNIDSERFRPLETSEV